MGKQILGYKRVHTLESMKAMMGLLSTQKTHALPLQKLFLWRLNNLLHYLIPSLSVSGMDVLGGGNGGLWGWNFLLPDSKTSRNKKRRFEPKSSNSLQATGGSGYPFPLKQYSTAGCLALTGDIIAQSISRWRKGIALNSTSLSDSASADKVSFRLFDSGLQFINFQ